MGCKPSPLGAITRVYMFERRSIYIDPHFLPITSLLYGRYVDDSGTLAKTRDQSNQMFSSIASQDPDRRLGFEVDYPDSYEEWTPFLASQIRIDEDGILNRTFYRKEQKKQITLHIRSHHPLKTKIEVAKNFYRSAKKSSSSPEYEEESYKIVDHLLQCNGYSNPRQMISCHIKQSPNTINKASSTACLNLPYISEQISNQILKFIKTSGLPIRVVFTPGKKLKDLFCSSRPYDKPKCEISNCLICPRLDDGKDCSIVCPVYLVKCNHCGEYYVGESCRSCHERLGEHLRYATNPDNPSYKNEAFAIHYNQHHPGIAPDLSFKIIRTERDTVLRKIFEAMYIYELKPSINDKEECKMLERFLLRGNVVMSDE